MTFGEAELQAFKKICLEVWDADKFKGVRNLQKISRDIIHKFMQYHIENQIHDQHLIADIFKEKDKHIKKLVHDFYTEKVDKRYSKGFEDLFYTKQDSVGFATVFKCPDKYFEDDNYIEEVILKRDQQKWDQIPHHSDPKYQELLQDLKETYAKTNKYIYDLKKSFDLDHYSERFMKNYLKNYCEKLAIKAREKLPNKSWLFSEHKREFEEIDPPEDDEKTKNFIKKSFKKLQYYEFTYGDFLMNYCRFLDLFAGLSIRLEKDRDDHVMIKYYLVNEEQLRGFAEAFEYDLQLKNYGKKYQEFVEESKHPNFVHFKSKSLTHQDQSHERLVLDRPKTQQFHQLNHHDQHDFPPYITYEEDKDEKYRKYTENDLFFEDPDDPEYFQVENMEKIRFNENVGNISPFRMIDKIRLMYMAFDDVLKINHLKKNELIEDLFFLRDFKAYEKALHPKKLILDKINIFNNRKQDEFAMTIRNFYGEKVAFYFLWITKFTKWLVFPSIVGIILFICDEAITKQSDSNKNSFIPIDYIYFIASVLFVAWTDLFIKGWLQNEKIYSCFWGMDDYSAQEPFDDKFNKDFTDDYLFGYQVPYQKYYKKVFRTVISYLISFTFSIGVIALLYYLFDRKDYYESQEDRLHETGEPSYKKISFWIGEVTAFQIKIFTYIYSKVVVYLTDWENHEKLSGYDQSLSIKTLLFEFINNYASLYYLSFIKIKLGGKCKSNNCWSELRSQIYTQLITIFLFNFVEIGLPFVMNKFRQRQFKRKYPNKEIDFSPHSVSHQLISDEYETVREDYQEILIFFGYLTFFSVNSPLVPLMIFCLVYVERLVDIYKIFYLSKVTIITGASGIGIYNDFFKIFLYIGMLTNFGLVVFTSPALSHTTYSTKLVTFIIAQNVFIVIMYLLSLRIYPKWFEYKYLIPILYNKNYYNKDSYSLPHTDLQKKKTVRTLTTLTSKLSNELKSYEASEIIVNKTEKEEIDVKID